MTAPVQGSRGRKEGYGFISSTVEKESRLRAAPSLLKNCPLSGTGEKDMAVFIQRQERRKKGGRAKGETKKAFIGKAKVVFFDFKK